LGKDLLTGSSGISCGLVGFLTSFNYTANVGLPAGIEKALIPAPTGISPTTAAEQKQNEKND
jgi:hypothetical protein